MNRRSFLKWMGLGVAAAPVAAKVAAKAIEKPAYVGIDMARGPDLTGLSFMGIPIVEATPLGADDMWQRYNAAISNKRNTVYYVSSKTYEKLAADLDKLEYRAVHARERIAYWQGFTRQVVP